MAPVFATIFIHQQSEKAVMTKAMRLALGLSGAAGWSLLNSFGCVEWSEIERVKAGKHYKKHDEVLLVVNKVGYVPSRVQDSSSRGWELIRKEC